MFSCKYCEIFKNKIFYKTTTVVPSINLSSGDSCRSTKWCTFFWKKSTVKCVFGSNSNNNNQIALSYISNSIKGICEEKWWQHREFIKAKIKLYKHYLLNKKHLLNVNIKFAKVTLCKASAVLFWPTSAKFC